MNSSWIRAEDRKRNAAAVGSTICIYAIAILAAWLLGRLAPVSLASVPSTVTIELGGDMGPPGEMGQGLPTAPQRPLGAPPGAASGSSKGSSVDQAPRPEAAAALPAPPPPAAPPSASRAAKAQAAIPEAPAKSSAKAAAATPKASQPTAPNLAAPKTAASPPKAPAPGASDAAKAAAAKDAVAQEAAAKEAAAAQVAAAQVAATQAAAAQAAIEARDAAALAAERSAPPKTRTFGSGTASSSGAGSAPGGTGTASSGSGGALGVPGGTGSVTFRGSEMGNALATTFGASSGLVGRNIYVPIYLYMPLPARIDESIFRNIAAKETFRGYYQQAGSEWRLKTQVPLAQRGDFWTALEAAGYDASTADFKTSRELSPVALEFSVGPLARNKVELIDLRLVSSSGSREVDEAVMYGFRQASFFNKTGNAVSGKFVYSF